jgi:hypothetical protein
MEIRLVENFKTAVLKKEGGTFKGQRAKIENE